MNEEIKKTGTTSTPTVPTGAVGTSPGPTPGHLSSIVEQLAKLTLGGLFLVIALVAAIAIAAGAWFSSSITESTSQKTATYQNLIDKVSENNQKIDSLTLEIRDLEKLYEIKQQGQVSQPIK